MKNFRKLFLFAVSAAVFSMALLMCSCGKTVSAPENLKANSSGVLSWTAADGVEYEVSVNGSDYVSAENNSVNLLEFVKSAEVNKIYVRAKQGKKSSEPAVYELSVVQLAAPRKAEISADPVTHENTFVWNDVPNANRYYYSINGGKWISTNKTSFTPVTTGNFNISVKARGYFNKNTIYLESAPSPVSDTLSFLLGPSLRNDRINCISWEAAEDFDSYNLWVDGVKVKENVTSPMNLVTGDDPVLTKTGEYDIQIEAIKGGKSAWSNIYEEFGTSNINQNEIYSFDNRICNLTEYRETAHISNERYHGDSGYSLKVFSDNWLQFNFIRYMHDVNVIDFRDVSRVSYWIYVESVDDYEYDYVPAYCLPAVKHGEPNVSFFSSINVPIGEWTKVTIDCENQYEITFLLVFHNAWADFWPDGKAHTYTMYLDDITYEMIDEDPIDDYEYKFGYNRAVVNIGQYYSNDIQRFNFGSENANKKVVLEMDVCGTVTGETTSNVGFALFNDLPANMSGAEIERTFGGYVTLERNKVSTLNWKKAYIGCTLNENGAIYLTGARTSNEGSAKPFKIYAKNIRLISEIDYRLEYTGIDGGWFNPALTGIDFGAEYANKAVVFSMKVCGTADPDRISEGLGFVKTDRTWLGIGIERAKISKVGEWSTITGTWTLDENGKMWTSAADYSGNCETFTIFVKDASVVLVCDYALEYTGSDGGWFNPTLTGIDFGAEYANKVVDFSMKVCGTADPDKTTEMLGFVKTDKSWLGMGIERAKISTMSAWSTITGTWTLDENGKMWTSAADYSGNCERFSIYVKDVTVLSVKTAEESGALNILTTAGSYYKDYYYGQPTAFSTDENNVTISVYKGFGGSGFLLKNTAVKAIYDLGISEISFTISTGGGYCGILFYEDAEGLDYLSNSYTVKDTETLSPKPVYIYADGARVTVNIAALVNCSAFMNATPGIASGGIAFNVLTSAGWSPCQSNSTVTLSDITVG